MKKRVFNADTQIRRSCPLHIRLIREIRSCSLRLCVSALFISVAVARAESPGTHYPSGGTRPGVSAQATAGTNAPYARTITVYGNVNTNDLLRFMDRTGSRVAGTNVLGALDYYGTNWQATAAAEASARAAGDTVARTNLQAALTAEALARAAGDVAGSNRLMAALASFAATGTVANAGTAGTAATAAYATSAGTAARLGDTNAWMTVAAGTGMVWQVSDDTTRVYIVSASGDFNGPDVGFVMAWSPGDGYYSATDPETEIPATVTPKGGLSENSYLNFGPHVWISPTALPAYFIGTGDPAVGTCVIDYIPITNSYPLATTNDIAAHNTNPGAHNDIRAAITDAPAWIGITNLAAAVTITNRFERPVYLYSTGTVAVAFSGLRTPMPLYLVLRGPDSLTFPGAYYVGGGTFQTNMSNHFVVWKYGTNLFVNAVTATED